MARYSIFDGGNRRLFPWENDRNSGIDPSYPVRYSAHLTNFHKVLRYHLDFQNEIFSTWVRDAMPTGQMEVNDELVTHLFGPGTVIRELAIQVKGVPPSTGANPGDPPPTPPTFTFEIQREDGTVAETIGTYTLDSTGYIWPDLEKVQLSNNGFLVARLDSGDASYSCFGILAELVQLIDGHSCSCLPKPCGADFPEPNCVPPGLTDGDRAGLGEADTGEEVELTVTGSAGIEEGTVEASYDESVTASGGTGPYTYAVTTGPLPDGLSLNASTGAITGTPTQAGSFPVVITATDDEGNTGVWSGTIVISGP